MDKKALFFTNTQNFDAPYEGTLGIYNNIDVRKEKNKLYLDVPRNNNEDERKLSDRLNDMILNPKYRESDLRKLGNRFLVNSWHMNEYESAAMWDIYSTRDFGIAIQSTIKRLCDSLEKIQKVSVSAVKYMDYNAEWIEEFLYQPFLSKRRSFEHEKELRAFKIIYDNDLTDNELKEYEVERASLNLPTEGKAINNASIFVKGRYIPGNLNTLLEKIYIHPKSSELFKEVLQSILAKYGISIDLFQVSQLYTLK